MGFFASLRMTVAVTMKVILLPIGKIRSSNIRELAGDYAKRLSHYLPFETKICRDEKQVLSNIGPSDFLVALDERGKQKSSGEMAAFLSEHQVKGTKRMAFIIGGQDGIGEETRKRANLMLGLSKMTFPHELAQAILLEQLYRACTIMKGEPYHRK